MSSNLKKILAVSLLLMLFCALSCYACADEGIVASGTCGENLTWELNSEGTLSIRGTGDMYNSPSWSDYRTQIQFVDFGWGSSNNITSIGSFAFEDCINLRNINFIPPSVETIGENPFKGCKSLESVIIENNPVISISQGAIIAGSRLVSYLPGREGGLHIPSEVTHIGAYAFYDCEKLTSVRIPSDVEYIDSYAFYGCNAKMEFSMFSSNVRYIGDYAFCGCSGFLNFDLLKIETIGCDAFSGSTIESLSIGDIQYYMEHLFDDNKAYVSIGYRAFYNCSNLKEISFWSEVDRIENGTFEGCSSLTNIEIPESTTSIGEFAFAGCGSLTSVHVPDNVKYMGYGALLDCTSLTSVTIDAAIPCVEYRTFEGCSSLTAVNIPNSVTSIGEAAFKNCSSLTEITIPGSVTSIGDNAFWLCSSLTTVNIFNGVTSIGEAAFKNCSSLTEITIPGSVTSIGDNAFWLCSSLTTVNIFNGVTSIGESAFMDCSNLTAITIPESVTSIGGGAFSGCSGLTSLSIPDSVTSIGGGTFSGCSGLTSLIIPYSVTSIGGGAFWGCSSLTSLGIPAGVTCIEANTFDGCSSLTAVNIPTGVTSIGECAFRGCSSLTSLSIPAGVTCIEVNTFDGCSGLTSLGIPDSVTSIGGGAFSGCSGLTSLIIPYSVTSIGGGAFWGCSSLTSLGIPAGVTCIEANTFDGCSSLTAVNIPTGVTSIGECAFRYCSSLTIVNIPDGVTSIGDHTFADCSSLTAINIPDGVTSIGGYAFSFCSGLTSLSIPAGVTSIGDYAFWVCNRLTKIEFTGNAPILGENCFGSVSATATYPVEKSGWTDTVKQNYGGNIVWQPSSDSSIIASGICGEELTWQLEKNGRLTISGTGDIFNRSGDLWLGFADKIETVLITGGVTSIGSSIFCGCNRLTSVSIPASVIYIGDCAFSGCSSLANIEFVGNAPMFGVNCFLDVSATATYPAEESGWTDEVKQNYGGNIVWQPSGDSSIIASGICGEELIWQLEKNGRLTISGTGDMFGYYNSSSMPAPWLRFADKIETVLISDGVTDISGYVFYGCNKLTSVSIPAGVTFIGWFAFAGCSRLTSVSIPASVIYIDECAFSCCSSLANIEFAGNAPIFGENCFLDVSATAIYLAGKSYWTETVKHNYGGQITWVALPVGNAESAGSMYAVAKDYYFGKGSVGINPYVLNAVTADLLSSYQSPATGSLPDGITYEGASLTLEDTVMVRHFFTVSGDVKDYTFKLGGTTVEPVQRGQYYTVDIAGIPFSALNQPHKIEVTSGSSQWNMSYCPLSYAYKALAAGADDNLCTLMKAMYLYYFSLNASTL